MQFSDIVGQKTTSAQLTELVKQNRLSHALLFLGKEGAGALPLAIAFSQYLLCDKVTGKSAGGTSLFATEPEPPITVAEACGTCPACVKAAQLAHPDIHFSYPVVNKKAGTAAISTDYIAEWREFVRISPNGNLYDWLQFIGAENKQGNITAAECNDIIRKLNLKSYEGDYKILVLWMPEYLEKEGNKLLKLIEEPPVNTLFILVAENESLILPTIVSRCQLVKVPLPSNADVAESLIKKAGVAPEQAAQLAAISEGNLREAFMLLQHAEEDWQAMLRDWLNAILKTGPVAQVKWVEEISKLGREKQKQFLRYFTHLLELAIRLKAINNAAPLGTTTEVDFADRLNKIADISQQQCIIEELDKASYFIERNANAKMLFQALTIKLYHIIADKSLILTS